MKAPVEHRRLSFLLFTVMISLSVVPSVRAIGNRPMRLADEDRRPMMVSLVFHHSTRGIHDHAFPILEAGGERATLGVVLQELEKTAVPPEIFGPPENLYTFGNSERISVGEADGEGLHTGRVFSDNPDGFMTEQEVVALADAGWELAFHGVDHTPQTVILAQPAGTNKLRRAYEAGAQAIARLVELNGKRVLSRRRVRTNTLASNAWNSGVRAVAREHFDWTEIRWAGGAHPLPVAYAPKHDLHGDFRSVDFQRGAVQGLEDLDDIARFAGNRSGGWLVIQLHDVVPDAEDSPDPFTAMEVDEFQYLVDRLHATGAEILPFSEAADRIHTDRAANRLRNTGFGINAFLNGRFPIGWETYVGPAADARMRFSEDGSVEFDSAVEPADFSLSQEIAFEDRASRWLLVEARVDTTGAAGEPVRIGMQGPRGTVDLDLPAVDGRVCLAVPRARVVGKADAVSSVWFFIRGQALQGVARVTEMSLTPHSGRRPACESASSGIRPR